MGINCRTFEKNLEDYLQDGLDFSLRFGMERHAQQCILCGRRLADALRLRQMARKLQRVKAPSNFEAQVLDRIAKSRYRQRIPVLGNFRIYSLERSLWRNLVLACLSVAVIGIAASFLYRRSFSRDEISPRSAATKPQVPDEKIIPAVNAEAKMILKPQRAEKTAEAEAPAVVPKSVPEPISPGVETLEVDYVEHFVPGTDDLPVTIRLPRAIHVQLGQTSEEYFIRNVSH